MGTSPAIFDMVSVALTSMISWFGDVVTALMQSALLPWIAIGLGFTVFGVCIGFFKRITGR